MLVIISRAPSPPTLTRTHPHPCTLSLCAVECPSGPDPMGGDGGAEGRDCSGRGTCDYTSGACSCYKGFVGERCEATSTWV